jgi:hypothetical protein
MLQVFFQKRMQALWQYLHSIPKSERRPIHRQSNNGICVIFSSVCR